MISGVEALTVPQVRVLLTAAFQALEERKQEINDLNVYPVPDGDTGTNLALTMRAVLDAVAKLPASTPARELCATISEAALMGARGNSGVILSQIIRGAMEVLGEADALDSHQVATALRHATDTAYRAVRKPVEGTMLTVLREMAEAAAEAETTPEITAMLEQVVEAGWRSVERTPSLLKVLADAGVVDAGGYGLVVLLEGMVRGEAARELAASPVYGPAFGPAAFYAQEAATEDFIGTTEEQSRYTYCTSFLVTGDNLDKSSLEGQLSTFGDSLLVVGDSRQLKVHVHTDEPGRVLTIGTSLGVLSSIEIDNMKEQTAARSRRLAGARPAEAGPKLPGVPGEPSEVLTQLVAVVAGEGNKNLFRNLGADFIVDGGQSMNPSAQDLLGAVEQATAPMVIILPNNANVVMTAEQTAKLAGREVLVVPSTCMQAGLSAAVAFERRNPGLTNLRDMQAALANVATGEITRAVRDAQVDGINIRASDYLGLVNDKVVISAPELETAVASVVERLLEGGRELLTALLGEEGEDTTRAKTALEGLRGRYPGVEIEMHQGGQPYYPLLLAAE